MAFASLFPSNRFYVVLRKPHAQSARFGLFPAVATPTASSWWSLDFVGVVVCIAVVFVGCCHGLCTATALLFAAASRQLLPLADCS